MIPDAHVSHTIPRRLRIKIPSKKGQTSYFDAVSNRLLDCPGVEDVKVNPATSSVVVTYGCETTALAAYGRRHGLFSLRQPKPRPKTLFQSVAGAFRSYNTSLKEMTNGEIDIPSLVFVTLVISGAWQLARGNFVMPAWYTAFYYALGVFSSAKVEEIDEGEELGGELEDGGGEMPDPGGDY